MARACGWISLFASLYYVTVYLSDRAAHAALEGGVALAVGGWLALVRWPRRLADAAWFRNGLPVGRTGWGVTAAALALGVARFVWVDAHAHSVGDALVGALPVWSLLAGVVLAIAAATRAPDVGA